MSFKFLTLEEFLKYKTLYYEKIDFTLVCEAWKILQKHIKLPFVIHIVGTNGKGSTGRFLAYYLYKKNYKVIHYSSPHIVSYNERVWLDGRDIYDYELEEAHNFLIDIYDEELLEKLTYFEYTTLMALYLSNNRDFLVLEAGLGGEYDATNVVQNDISLITTIGLDHTNFLGNSIFEIARTKMRSVDKKMIIGFQEYDEVYEVAKLVKKELLEEFNKEIEILDLKNCDFHIKLDFPLYLKRNLELVIKCLEELNIPVELNTFKTTPLFGRFQKIRKNITIDVGHNPLAASVLLEELKNKKITLIYNSYADKDYKEVLNILKPIIKNIYIIDLDDKRVVNKEDLKSIIEKLKLNLLQNLEIKDEEEYLVFGSFLVVEKFLTLIAYESKS